MEQMQLALDREIKVQRDLPSDDDWHLLLKKRLRPEMFKDKRLCCVVMSEIVCYVRSVLAQLGTEKERPPLPVSPPPVTPKKQDRKATKRGGKDAAVVPEVKKLKLDEKHDISSPKVPSLSSIPRQSWQAPKLAPMQSYRAPPIGQYAQGIFNELDGEKPAAANYVIPVAPSGYCPSVPPPAPPSSLTPSPATVQPAEASANVSAGDKDKDIKDTVEEKASKPEEPVSEKILKSKILAEKYALEKARGDKTSETSKAEVLVGRRAKAGQKAKILRINTAKAWINVKAKEEERISELKQAQAGWQTLSRWVLLFHGSSMVEILTFIVRIIPS